MLNIEGNRWAQSGNYLYSVDYNVANASGASATYSLLDFTLSGPAGETLPGYSSIDVGRPVAIAAAAERNSTTLLSGVDPGHPYAERVRLRITYQAQNGHQGVLTGEDIVLHGPQSARLHDFSMSPPGYEPGAALTSGVRLGEPVTVRWNVEGAKLVVLESSLEMTASGGGGFKEAVEALGSRTFITGRDGVASATLDIDRGAIRRLLLIGVRR
jgi:hypothetical protein